MAQFDSQSTFLWRSKICPGSSGVQIGRDGHLRPTQVDVPRIFE